MPVDIKRFKIKDYDELNIWFNDYYVNYLNKKFAFTPLDPNSEFVDIVDEHFDYNRIFSVEFERTMGPNSKARRNEAASVKELDEILNNLDKK